RKPKEYYTRSGLKLRDEPVFTPTDVIKYAADDRKVAIESFNVPERLIVTYQRSVFKHVQQTFRGRPKEWLHGDAQPFVIMSLANVEIGIARSWIGSPAAAMVLEELVACGAKKVFEVGCVGALQPTLQPGDMVVVSEAIRDEGTSHHYFPQDVELESSLRLRDLLAEVLSKKRLQYRIGSVWTTDGVYRETKRKLLRLRGQGVLGVNMETSALFAVAKYRGVEMASAQVVSDVLSEQGWLPAFGQRPVREGLKALTECVVEALAGA
ncbi:MAG: nucleoside phosphorylase, partial [Candidatus Bathyarchaeota archaeon]|nr:nucleoside phosphorylase [Candidatus Bathyarchaeota archaeon]